MNPTIINIVSGKGGTGKTLLACVLADMLGNAPDAKTIVVDLDIFVRGLTSLLYFHREEKLHIVEKHKLTVSDFFVEKIRYPNKDLGIVKYRSFDVLPAVHRIDQKLDYQDLAPNTRHEAKVILSALLSCLADDYRYIILDSRAGYDELIAATHEISTISICVEEQDQISKVTSDNLISQLDEQSTPTFRLINKARGVKSPNDIDFSARSVTDIGAIPFDMDILNNFGTSGFWDVTGRSLYRWALANAWNTLNSKLQFGTRLSLPRLSPIMSEAVESRIGFLTLKDRVFFVYGLVLAMFGAGYSLVGSDFLTIFKDDPLRVGASIMGIVGFSMAVTVLIRRPKR
ncbi:ParA family protein [Pseudomonas atacamensis]|uniref:ParA family protein n=1 Tax=Pseudomonas atacamensis TaxID=2565368 RepID=UPI002B45E496|nr:ParA family protein [Pseudomonas atacamensis]MEB2854070.1 ParA family protein [Pseudomonas atacamensis]